MNDRETRHYNRFNLVKTFGAENAADIPAGSEAEKCFTEVARIIKELEDAKAGQEGGSNTAREVLVASLRLDLQNIARTARGIALKEPGFADCFRLPEEPTQRNILTCADAFLGQLAEKQNDSTATKAAKAALVARFVAHSLPADFVQNLKDDRQAITDDKSEQEGQDLEGVESTSAIGRLIRDGNVEVTILDAIMHNLYTRNPDKLRAWKSASHVERAPKREKTAAKTTPPSA